MSSRDLAAAIVTAADGQVVRPVTFVELAFDSPTGTLYVHNDIGPITANDWDGTSQTWEGVGDFGGIDEFEEGDEVSPYAVTLVLSGIDSTIASTVLTDDTVLRDVRILQGLLDEDRALVAQPHPMWEGFIDDQQVAIGDESVIRVTAESRMIAFEETNGILFNDSDQQELFAGDVGFEYLPQMLDAKIQWGGDEKFFRTGGGPGSVGFMGRSVGSSGFREAGRGMRARRR